MDTVLLRCLGWALLQGVGIYRKDGNIFHGDPHRRGWKVNCMVGGGGHVVTPAGIASASPHPSQLPAKSSELLMNGRRVTPSTGRTPHPSLPGAQRGRGRGSGERREAKATAGGGAARVEGVASVPSTHLPHHHQLGEEKMCLYQVQTPALSEWKKQSPVVEEPPSGRVDGAVKGT